MKNTTLVSTVLVFLVVFVNPIQGQWYLDDDEDDKDTEINSGYYGDGGNNNDGILDKWDNDRDNDGILDKWDNDDGVLNR